MEYNKVQSRSFAFHVLRHWLAKILLWNETLSICRQNCTANITDRLQKNFDTLLDWFAVNHFSLNTSKMKSMLFCKRRSHFKQDVLTISSGEKSIESVETMKYFWIHLDRHLTFQHHMDIRNVIPESLARYVHTTLIHPLSLYWHFLCDSCSVTLKHKLPVNQSNTLRAITKCPKEYPVQKLHDELQIDYLNVTRKKSTLKIVYRGLNGLGPTNLNKMFTSGIPWRNCMSINDNPILPLCYIQNMGNRTLPYVRANTGIPLIIIINLVSS